jgi:hypothetical protein
MDPFNGLSGRAQTYEGWRLSRRRFEGRGGDAASSKSVVSQYHLWANDVPPGTYTGEYTLDEYL